MKTVSLELPLLGFIVGTRAALACGVGLLLADRMPPERRRTLATALIAFGAVTTIPAVRSILSRVSRSDESVRAAPAPR